MNITPSFEKIKPCSRVRWVLLLSLIVIAPQTAVRASATDSLSRENAVVRAVRKVGPAVVNIASELAYGSKSAPFSGLPLDPFFENFFRDFFDAQPEHRRKRSSLGSGVIIDGHRGFILTNAHVIEKTGTITVLLQDEREFQAQIVGADPDSDLAVLRIRSDSPLPSATMGRSDDLMIGETIIAIGNPFGFSHTVTTGVISALNRSFRTDDRTFNDFIQLDASINPGNSGGPLLNINGELIGVNTAIYAKAQGIGFAIPIDTARRIVSDLIAHGEVVRPWIGIRVQNIDPTMGTYLAVEKARGVMIRDVMPKSPAAQAGLESGDVLLEVGRRTIANSDDFRQAFRGFAVGDPIPVAIWRGGRKLSLQLPSIAFPEGRALELGEWLLGVRVTDQAVGRRTTRESKTGGVAIAEVRPGSFLSRIGVKTFDIILQLDDVIIRDLKGYAEAIARYYDKASLVLLLQRGDQGYYIPVKL